jgi:hypothetical protein
MKYYISREKRKLTFATPSVPRAVFRSVERGIPARVHASMNSWAAREWWPLNPTVGESMRQLRLELRLCYSLLPSIGPSTPCSAAITPGCALLGTKFSNLRKYLVRNHKLGINPYPLKGTGLPVEVLVCPRFSAFPT